MNVFVIGCMILAVAVPNVSSEVLLSKIVRNLGDTGLKVLFEWNNAAADLANRELTEADYYNISSKSHVHKRQVGRTYRPGSATETHSCNSIRAVPSHLRTSSGILPNGLNYFYQKYTEAYGIPVLASSSVTDNALKRACYVTRFLMADHSGVRNWYYRLSGRVAVIGAQEQTTQIPEHSWLPAWWNQRARGLGATESAPVSTGGEENLLCYTNDRYRNEDIFLHEFSHGVHLLGAKYAIPGWDSRLTQLYNRAKSMGLWSNTYAMSTDKEYFAEGTQSYFNCNAYANPPNGIHNSIDTRAKLRTYDPSLYQLIKEVFPCGNTYLKRCESTRANELNQQLKMNCDRDGGGNDGGEDTTARPTTAAPGCVDNNSNCADWARRGECNKNPAYMHVNCKRSCNKCGGGCVDKNSNCADWARRGECNQNPAYMHVNCKRSCNTCGVGASCNDNNQHCVHWASTGECTKNPAYMLANCKRSCRSC